MLRQEHWLQGSQQQGRFPRKSDLALNFIVISFFQHSGADGLIGLVSDLLIAEEIALRANAQAATFTRVRSAGTAIPVRTSLPMFAPSLTLSFV